MSNGQDVTDYIDVDVDNLTNMFMHDLDIAENIDTAAIPQPSSTAPINVYAPPPPPTVNTAPNASIGTAACDDEMARLDAQIDAISQALVTNNQNRIIRVKRVELKKLTKALDAHNPRCMFINKHKNYCTRNDIHQNSKWQFCNKCFRYELLAQNSGYTSVIKWREDRLAGQC